MTRLHYAATHGRGAVFEERLIPGDGYYRGEDRAMNYPERSCIWEETLTAASINLLQAFCVHAGEALRLPFLHYNRR